MTPTLNLSIIVITFLNVGVCVVCTFETTGRKFERVLDIKLSEHYKQFTGISSATQCNVECGRDEKCGAVSYHAADRICNLSDRGLATNTTGWTVYKGPCDVGWVLYNGWCYLPVTQTQTWTAAESTCQLHGAHLVKVDSDEEYTFLLDIATSYFWIGLSDSHNEGNYKWVSDNSSPAYQRWDTNEPGGGTGENCAAGLNSWHDYNCNGLFKSVCEKLA